MFYRAKKNYKQIFLELEKICELNNLGNIEKL